jgi:hypothetical protein
MAVRMAEMEAVEGIPMLDSLGQTRIRSALEAVGDV